jgi:hypothetical protein
MIGRNRSLAFALALVVALAVFVVFAGAALAAGGDDTKATTDVICVDGYVINHRELAVNGTKVDLAVEAVSATGTYSATVDANGYFKFKDIPAGDYNFRMQLPDGWEGIVPQADRAGIAETGITTLKTKDGCYRIVFKIRRVFDVIVIKWEELLDFTVRPGEGWTITATPVKDPYVKPQTQVTDAGGQAYFTLTAGDWTLAETVKNGWTPVTPKQVSLHLDQYAPAGALDPVVFKNKQPACKSEIIVQKIGYGTDANDQDVQLGPLAGWKVTVARADKKAPPVTKVTDGSGKATFGGLPPGVYKVTETVQPGWEVVGDNPLTVIHMDCETTNVTFNNREIPGQLKIYGTKWFKAWEKPYKGQMVGLSGWEITAKLVGTDTMTTTVTNALGQYTFSEKQLKDAGIAFPGASVDVCEEDRDNWIHKTPKCVVVTFPYPVPATYTGVKVDFVNYQDPPMPGASAGTVSASGACSAYHVVNKGETLGMIAGSYGTSIGAIARANGVKNIDLVYTGQKLCIK